MNFYFTEIPSPVGQLKLVVSDTALIAILWENEKPNRVKLPEMKKNSAHPLLIKTTKQLDEYFAGKRTKFSIPLAPLGTPFQMEVWQALCEIPFGETRSYGELAKFLGRPLASRAVGAANGKNPISIIVPCHRVIGASGGLTGFAGGIEAKELLLRREKINL